MKTWGPWKDSDRVNRATYRDMYRFSGYPKPHKVKSLRTDIDKVVAEYRKLCFPLALADQTSDKGLLLSHPHGSLLIYSDKPEVSTEGHLNET